MHHCCDAPKKELISQAINRQLIEFAQGSEITAKQKKAMLVTADRFLNHPPCKNYALTILYNLDPDHEIFAKDYVKPKPVREVYVEEIQINDEEQFF